MARVRIRDGKGLFLVNGKEVEFELGMTVLAGASGLSRTPSVPRIQKPGLALTGWPEQLHDKHRTE